MRLILVVITIFCLGFLSGHLLGSILIIPEMQNMTIPVELALSSVVQSTLPILQSTDDVPSPFDRVQESQIQVHSDKVVLDIPNAYWATFIDTNSMDPVLDQGANAIQVAPKSPSEIYVGDIVSYTSAQGTIIHRVTEIGTDEHGWYAIVKGDNNAFADGKVRFDQIKRVLVAIIY